MSELIEALNQLEKEKDIDKEVKNFWKEHKTKLKKFYMIKDHKNDIIISASPEFLLNPICKELKVKDLIASDVDKKTGHFNKPNNYKEEKVKKVKVFSVALPLHFLLFSEKREESGIFNRNRNAIRGRKRNECALF